MAMSDLMTKLTKITELITIKETDYPELYQFVDEDPHDHSCNAGS